MNTFSIALYKISTLFSFSIKYGQRRLIDVISNLKTKRYLWKRRKMRLLNINTENELKILKDGIITKPF